MEEWKDIPGFEEIYEASNLGRIRSKEGKTTNSALHGTCHWKQRIIQHHYTKRKSGKNFDAKVTLWKDKEPHYYLVSRLIALSWVTGYSKGMTVNHIDGNPLNNRADNLEWISLRDNIIHGFETGLYSNQKPIKLVLPDGKIIPFRSLSAASRYLGKNSGYISEQLNNNRKIRDATGNVYEVAG